jgi:hypothetical protein
MHIIPNVLFDKRQMCIYQGIAGADPEEEFWGRDPRALNRQNCFSQQTCELKQNKSLGILFVRYLP